MSRFRFLALLIVLLALPASAVDRITATVLITNAPTVNGNTFVITTTAASTRTWTNSVVTPSVQILTNATVSGSATNLQNHLELYPPAGITSQQTTPTNVTIYGQAGVPLTISGAGNYFRVTYATQAVTTAYTVRTPYTVEAATIKTNVGNGLVNWLEQNFVTDSIDQNSFSVSELLGKTNTQTVTGNKTFSGVNEFHGTYYGNAVGLTNVSVNELRDADGRLRLFFDDSTVDIYDSDGLAVFESTTNGNTVIYTTITGVETARITIGPFKGELLDEMNSAAQVTWRSNAVSVGTSVALVADTITLGKIGGQNVAIGSNVTVGATATVTGSTHVAGGLKGTMSNLTNGTAYNPTIEGGTLARFTASGTNLFPAHSDISFARYAITTLANGNNAGVIVGTNLFIEVSGPSGAFTINGLTAGPNRDGKEIEIYNQTGQTMTIANESGTDPTAGNRIRTGYGADITVTNNPGCVALRYSGAASRWLIKSKTP